MLSLLFSSKAELFCLEFSEGPNCVFLIDIFKVKTLSWLEIELKVLLTDQKTFNQMMYLSLEKLNNLLHKS